MAEADVEYDESDFTANEELSDIISKLWDIDDNKCYPGTDYELDLQGYLKYTSETDEDWAHNKLFSYFNPDVWERPTYKAFRALLDNYSMDVSEEEKVTRQEIRENHEFLDTIMETEVMKRAHQYLSACGKVGEDDESWKDLLYDIWFKLFRRGGGSEGSHRCNSSSFEHVFVGEGRGEEMIGLHNWLQFYLQEAAGNIDYHGYFHRKTVTNDSIIRLLAVQFDWNGTMAKPLCSVFIGSSPEFEIAAYTITLLLDRDGKADVQLGEYEVELTVHSFGGKYKKLGTAYIAGARMGSYAKQNGYDKKNFRRRRY